MSVRMPVSLLQPLRLRKNHMQMFDSKAYKAVVKRNACLAAVCLLLPIIGCVCGCKEKKDDKKNSPAAEAQLQGVDLELLVVDDRGMASAIEKTRGEWLAQTGSKLTVKTTTEKDLPAKGIIDADAIICASYMMGELAERDLIVPLPQDVLAANSSQWQDIFVLERAHEAVWGDAPMAVPFGSPVLICYCRTDILKHLDVSPPRTWSEYDRLVEMLADREKLGNLAPPRDRPWNAAIEPLAPGWAGLMLLARAAPLAKHADNYSTLFDINTMRPLIAGPPFVRALEQMVAARSNASAPLTHNPDTARAAFWQGRCAMAVTWPTSADGPLDAGGKSAAPHAVKPSFTCTPIELPGSLEVYNIDESRWTQRDRREEIRVPLLATTGRLGLIAKGSPNHRSAARLLMWLAGNEQSPPIGAHSPHSTLYSLTQLRSPHQWVEPQISTAAARSYGELSEQTFDRPQWLFALRIPGRTQYLAALDEAVRESLADGTSPRKALREAADEWQAVTDRLGKENQRRAYRKSLELRP